MATTSELKSLDEISYRIQSKLIFAILIPMFLFFAAFVLNFPIATKIKHYIKKSLVTPQCQINFKDLSLEAFLPKVIISDVYIPKTCSTLLKEDLKLSQLTVKWQIINFFPFGIPLKAESTISGQNLEFYYVQGINQSLIRLKDQTIDFRKIDLPTSIKLGGKILLDLNLLVKNQNLDEFNLKVTSNNLILPSQNFEGFQFPELNLKDFFIEANTEGNPKINVQKFIVGTPDSPLRASFKGSINYKNQNVSFSPISLNGELFFSQDLKEKIPLLEMFFQSYNQKDGFYQLKLGGTLGAPKLIAL